MAFRGPRVFTGTPGVKAAVVVQLWGMIHVHELLPDWIRPDDDSTNTFDICHKRENPNTVLSLCHASSADRAERAGWRSWKIKIAPKNSDERVNTAWKVAARSAHLLTSHHFYSLRQHACQIPLKVQVSKTIQMPRIPGALLEQRPLPHRREREPCHFCLPQWAKLGHFCAFCSICQVLT